MEVETGLSAPSAMNCPEDLVVCPGPARNRSGGDGSTDYVGAGDDQFGRSQHAGVKARRLELPFTPIIDW